MSTRAKLFVAAALVLFGAALPFSLDLLLVANAQEGKPPVPNPAIDMEGYLKVSKEAAEHRKTRRLSEEDFIKMASEPGTVVLDCRSADKYKLMHVRGAINLSFPD